ncbi:uncharacterized protein LOC113227063 [Hyposmocoma kahamanoa]|uniref:uncharacterized protein LOC113227063 n=1 Tax=Hyposmocoma kahamanoa TaxID=1477025 RepID=UPI000E6D7312|nr:uncharacterized protein LOC113227063 [Hyposmocoma kahamanoa]
MKYVKELIVFNIVLIKTINGTIHDLNLEVRHPPFDPRIYEDALDPELCAEQMRYLTTNGNMLMVTFIEAGLRLPRGVTQGNLLDLGNYHQCLGINKEVEHMTIKGKYCRISVGLNEELINRINYSNINLLDEEINIKLEMLKTHTIKSTTDRAHINEMERLRSMDSLNLTAIQLSLSICIPKPCSIKEDMTYLVNEPSLVKYKEEFCRFKGDKPWTPGLYVAVVIFSLLGLLTVLSTSYDVWHTFILNRDPKASNTLYRSFSIYTNARRLTTFTTTSGALDCIDGIRAITMAWVVIGHTFLTTSPILNVLESIDWVLSFQSIWLTAAPISVDTFFLLSGFLLVYSSVGKLSNMKLLRNLHLFYLTRILRLFPLLALIVLLQSTVFHYVADGPSWTVVARMTENCRINWWSTLLYVQNYVHPMCVEHSWYLAIDMQLHILSPIVLFWVLTGNKSIAWSALITALLASLIASTIFNFLHNFPAATLVPSRLDDILRYSRMYYINTLTRCSPFFVGMLFGYLVHICREKGVILKKYQVLILWVCALIVLSSAFYATTPAKNMEWDNQIADNFINSFMRPCWAVGVGWLIFACATGYGGPVNWFLSLRMWKLPSRLSYAIYLFHYPIQTIIAATYTEHVYVSVTKMVSIKLVNKLSVCMYSDRNNRVVNIQWEPKHPPFDPNIYEEVLDSELCEKQIQYLTLNDTLLMMTFLEAGPRMPRGILQGNFQDIGNYRQCLGINKEVDDMVIEGKYCQISVGFSQLVNFGDTSELEKVERAVDSIKDKINLYDGLRQNVHMLDGIELKDTRTGGVLGGLQFSVAICLPKPCSTRRALSNLIGTPLINYQEQFCRFKNDKPWAPSVYVAIVVFSLIGLLAILSTSYDIWNTNIRKLDPKSLNTICLSFSAYTNARRLITYKPVRGALECVDGIRVISMTWVVLAHSFSGFIPIINSVDVYLWAMSSRSTWLTSAQIGVDTFFVLSGLLLVYTTVGKISSMKLLKNLHLFYLNRILRMFPLLATTVLLQVGVLHYIHDGPWWYVVAFLTSECRINWWSTLLYVQNYIRPMCLAHTWYLAIDMQLYILSPLILLWVLSGKKNFAWSALIAGVLVSLTASSIYVFVNNFTGSSIRPILDPEEGARYGDYYYFNTLTRCSPFFIGMCFGYLIHFWREKNIRLSKILNLILWILNLGMLWTAFYAITPMKNANFNNQTYDNFVNSFMRPVWALGIGWLILVCAEGYGGPINWFLSLRLWKLPSRLSFAIYLLHHPIQFVITASTSQHVYFSVMNFFYMFFGRYVIYFIVSFIFAILVDSPFANIVKVILGGGIKKSNPEQPSDKTNIQKPNSD